jgi:hypothetical protein
LTNSVIWTPIPRSGLWRFASVDGKNAIHDRLSINGLACVARKLKEFYAKLQ